HPSISSWHSLTPLWLVDGTGRRVAFLLCSDTPARFTAIDLFKNVWCFLRQSDTSVAACVAGIRKEAQYLKHEIDVFVGDGTTSPEWD
ncbi:hypothetical protein ABTK14_21830, partial [Acinetobacter baumannii]